MSDDYNYMKLNLHATLSALGQTQRALARHCRISPAAINQICKFDKWPKSLRVNETALRPLIVQFLQANGASTEQVLTAFDELFEGVHPLCSSTAGALVSHGQQATIEEDILMLLRHQRLSGEARQHFRILRDPFVNEMRGGDDVYLSDDIRYVRASVRQTAQHGGMLAVTGESGSGKSTIRKDLREWINSCDEQIIVMEPFVICMSSDRNARPLLAADIVGAVIRNIAPSEPLRAGHERRSDQMHKVLRASAQVGNKHVLIIEEAHDLAVPTLKALKRFYEMEDGFKKLLSIVLVGQPELARKLSEKNPEVREVVQRCELVTLPPLNSNVADYLRHKFKRVDMDWATVVEPDAVDAIRTVLRRNVSETLGGKRVQHEQSLCYPLAVNNLLTRAMNQAVLIGSPKVDAALINAAIRGGSDE